LTLPITAALLGVLIAASILMLVRRGHLHGGQAVWWLMAAGSALLLGLFPGWIDRVGVALGVAYPPMLLAVLAIVALLIKMLVTDIELARKERRLRRLTQKLALLEFDQQNAGSADPRLPSQSPEARRGPRRGVG
jgi:hypothetical protein